MTSLGDLLEDEGPLRVIVELKARSVEKAHLRRLEEVGLVVDRVIRNKVIGRIPSAQLSALQLEDMVAAVERSVDLKRHS